MSIRPAEGPARSRPPNGKILAAGYLQAGDFCLSIFWMSRGKYVGRSADFFPCVFKELSSRNSGQPGPSSVPSPKVVDESPGKETGDLGITRLRMSEGVARTDTGTGRGRRGGRLTTSPNVPHRRLWTPEAGPVGRRPDRPGGELSRRRISVTERNGDGGTAGRGRRSPHRRTRPPW